MDNKLHPVIERAAERYDISPHVASEYQSLFDKCAEWFKPTNRRADEYSRAQVLHFLGLLDCRRLARLNSSQQLRGFTIEFKQAAALSAHPTGGDGDGHVL